MYEIAIASQLKNKSIIDYLLAKAKKELKEFSPIITSYCDNNFSFLLLACDFKFVDECESFLKSAIVDYIITEYKVKYLKNKIKNPLCDELTFGAYVKVLSVFDRQTDESVLIKNIQFNQTFFVDSYLEFRLDPLKKHWDNLAELSCDNITMFNSGTFVDVIKFLINTMDNDVYKVKVIIDDETCSVYNMKNKNAKITKVANCDSAMELISNVLNVCPNYVDVYLNTNENCEAVRFLSNIFANRLKIYMKN